MESIYERSVEDMDICQRIKSIFIHNGIYTVMHLVERTEGDLVRMKGFGLGSLHYIKGWLQINELSLSEEPKIKRTIKSIIDLSYRDWLILKKHSEEKISLVALGNEFNLSGSRLAQIFKFVARRFRILLRYKLFEDDEAEKRLTQYSDKEHREGIKILVRKYSDKLKPTDSGDGMKTEVEYKVEQGKTSDIQMKLNQWRHKYNILVVGQSSHVDPTGETVVVMTIARTPKPITEG